MSELPICVVIFKKFMSLKIHNFLISHPILLKLFLIGLSDFSDSIESKLFLEWTWGLLQAHNILHPSFKGIV